MTTTEDVHTLAVWAGSPWWADVADDLTTIQALPHRTLDDLATVARRLDELAAILRDTRTVIARRLADDAYRLPKTERTAMVDGQRRVVDVSSERVRRRYDNRLVAAAFGARIAEDCADTADGEPVPPAVLGQFVALGVASACGALTDSFDGWRAADAAKHGVDLARYRDETREGRTAKVR